MPRAAVVESAPPKPSVRFCMWQKKEVKRRRQRVAQHILHESLSDSILYVGLDPARAQDYLTVWGLDENGQEAKPHDVLA